VVIVFIPLITEGLKLINNILEGTPIEVRKAHALAWWAAWEPVVLGTIKSEAIKQAIKDSITQLQAGKIA
jgi:hypothetical protein